MSELPFGWTRVPLGDICEVLDAYRVPVSAREREKRPGQVPYYGATGPVGSIDQALFDEELVLLGEDAAPFLHPAKPKAYIIHGPAWVNNHAHVLRARSVTSNRFLLYALNWTDYRPFVNGTTRLKLTQGAMTAIPIPLAPRPEQDRILAAIEEQFSRLDEAVRLLQNAWRRLGGLTSAVIDMATSGFPTQPIANLIREPLRNGHSARRSDRGNIPIFTLTAVTARDFCAGNTKLTDADPGRVADLWAEPSDIFIERSNTPELVGTAALYAGPGKQAIFPDLLIRVRVVPDILPEYAELGLRSTRVRRYFQRAAKGIAGSMPKIDQAAILAAELPLPSLPEQRLIMAEVDRQLTGVTLLGSTIHRGLIRSDRLRQAILQRAFTGQLVPQDPGDEPASELLARIMSERATDGKPRRGQLA